MEVQVSMFWGEEAELENSTGAVFISDSVFNVYTDSTRLEGCQAPQDSAAGPTNVHWGCEPAGAAPTLYKPILPKTWWPPCPHMKKARLCHGLALASVFNSIFYLSHTLSHSHTYTHTPLFSGRPTHPRVIPQSLPLCEPTLQKVFGESGREEVDPLFCHMHHWMGASILIHMIGTCSYFCVFITLWSTYMNI